MSSEIVLKVQNIGKRYEIYEAPHHRLLQTLLRGRKQFYREFWALKDVSFDLRKGECLGIIGRNGSGKSTLLQIIAGTLSATSGCAEANGKVAALLELGGGFNPEFTGRENVYMHGAITGLSKADMDEKFAAIAGFADIGEFIDQPVKIYSSGMYVRLAFAAAINVDPDILIVDEALSVGDVRFQQKCLRRLKKFKDDGRTVLFVSHDMSAIKLFCDKTIWLEQGQLKKIGLPGVVTKEYLSFMEYGLESESAISKEISAGVSAPDSTDSQELKWESTEKCSSFGKGGATILATTLYSKKRRERITMFEGGEEVSFFVKIKADKRIEMPLIGFLLNDDRGVNLIGYNTHNLGLKLKPIEPGETKTFRFEFKFPRLKPGQYLFSAAVADGTLNTHEQLHWVHDAYVVRTAGTDEILRMGGYFAPENPLFFE